MFTKSSVYDAAIEENLGSVGDIVERFQGLLELIVVVVP